METNRKKLRSDAEAQLAGIEPAEEELHDLQVHQIELEMQNETLRQTQIELEESRDRYLSLYEFSPLAYLTLDENGVILEINLTGASLFGVERKNLLGRRLARYIAVADAPSWQRNFQQVLQADGTSRFELQLLRSGGVSFPAQLDFLCTARGSGQRSVRITISNLSERKKTEAALWEINEKLRLFVEYAPSAIAMFNLDMQYVAYSHRWLTDYELQDRGELAGRSHYDIFPELPEQWKEIHRRCLSGATEKCDEDRFVRTNGTEDWVRWEIHPWRTRQGEIGGIIIFSEVITARRQAELSLRESEAKLRIMFDGALNGILLVDPATLRFIDGNAEICRMLGYSLEELIQLGVSDIHPPRDLPRILEQLESHIRGERQISTDIPVKRRDGSVFYVDIKSGPIRLSGRDYLVGIFRDTTERRQAEAIRRISALRHQLLFENSRDALMTLSPPSWHFTSANDATLKLFGAASVDEFTLFGPSDVSPERQPDGALSGEKSWQQIGIALQQGSCNFEWQHRRMDGTLFTADVLLTRMDLGEESFLQATVRDISDRKRTEHELQEYQQLLRDLATQGAASREAELKHVAREVHDELGQILTALRMDISLLRIQFGEHDPLLMSKIHNMLSLVDQAIQGARDVTSNLRPAALDMGVVPAIAWLCDEFPGRTHTACTLHVLDDPAGLDETQTMTLFRIVQESLTNIARHAAASRVDITIKRCNDDIAVEVCDDGRGFDMSASPAKQSFGLLGMKERALALGGRVEVISKPAEGTAVCVHIPAFKTKQGRRSDDTYANSRRSCDCPRRNQ